MSDIIKKPKKKKSLLETIYNDHSFEKPVFDENGNIVKYDGDETYKEIIRIVQERTNQVMNSDSINVDYLMRSMLMSINTKTAFCEVLEHEAFKLIMSRIHNSPEEIKTSDLVNIFKNSAKGGVDATYELKNLMEVVNSIKLWEAEEKQKIKHSKLDDSNDLSDQQKKAVLSALTDVQKRVNSVANKSTDKSITVEAEWIDEDEEE